MTKAKTILKAWKEVVKGNTTDEHRRRSEICSKCPKAVHSTMLNLVKDELKEIKGFKCLDCGCPLSAKIRSEDVCYKWKK